MSLISKWKIDNVLLTPRESECLYYAMQGNNYAQIAKIMHISLTTVGIHFSSMKAKAGVKTKEELLALVKI